MDLVRDVLDKQLVDRHSDRMGKVDGVVLTVGSDGRPRVSAIEVGAVVLAERLSSRLARAVAQCLAWIVGDDAGRARFPVRLVRGVDVEVMLDVDADKTPARRVEHWVRSRIVTRIPGSGAK